MKHAKTPREYIRDLYQVEDDIRVAEERLNNPAYAKYPAVLEDLQRMRDERKQRIPHIRSAITEQE